MTSETTYAGAIPIMQLAVITEENGIHSEGTVFGCAI